MKPNEMVRPYFTISVQRFSEMYVNVTIYFLTPYFLPTEMSFLVFVFSFEFSSHKVLHSKFKQFTVIFNSLKVGFFRFCSSCFFFFSKIWIKTKNPFRKTSIEDFLEENSSGILFWMYIQRFVFSYLHLRKSNFFQQIFWCIAVKSFKKFRFQQFVRNFTANKNSTQKFWGWKWTLIGTESSRSKGMVYITKIPFFFVIHA